MAHLRLVGDASQPPQAELGCSTWFISRCQALNKLQIHNIPLELHKQDFYKALLDCVRLQHLEVDNCGLSSLPFPQNTLTSLVSLCLRNMPLIQ